MQTGTALVLTVSVLCYAVISGLVRRWCIAPALVFVAVGVVLGPSGFEVIPAGKETENLFRILAQLGLTVILFHQAASLDPRNVDRRGHVVLRLLLIGIPLTIALGTLTAVVLLPVLPLWEAVCLAAIVAPTEVALIDGILEERRIPKRVRHALSVESGFYDGFALATLLAALALASQHAHPAHAHWAWFAFRTEIVSLVVGAAIGLIGGTVISRSNSRGWMSDTWAQLATLALALACYGAGERLQASGFVATFAGGLAYALVRISAAEGQANTYVIDAAGQLLELLVFAILGGFAVIPAWRNTNWRVVLFAVIVLTAVRVAAVAAAMIGASMSSRSTLFMGWFGPRGMGTLVLGLLVIERGHIHHGELIAQAAIITVTVSLLVHSLTAAQAVRVCQEPDIPAPDTQNTIPAASLAPAPERRT